MSSWLNPKVRGFAETGLVVVAACLSIATLAIEFFPRTPVPQSAVLPDSIPVGGARVPIGGGGDGRIVIWMNYECESCHEFAEMLEVTSTGAGTPLGYDMILVARQGSRRGASLVATVLCANEQGAGELVHREFVKLSLTERDTATVPWERIERATTGIDWPRVRECASRDSIGAVVAQQVTATSRVGIQVTPAFLVGRSLYTWWPNDQDVLTKVLRN